MLLKYFKKLQTRCFVSGINHNDTSKAEGRRRRIAGWRREFQPKKKCFSPAQAEASVELGVCDYKD